MLPDTLLPLTRFSELIGYSPVLFNQVYIPGEQEPSACSDPVLEYMWQQRGGGQPGRADIARAVQRAEETLELHLGFSVAPKPREDVLLPARTRSGYAYASPYDITLSAKSGYVQQMGAYRRSFVTTAPVNYVDADGDGYLETGTVQVVTAYPVSELHVYHRGTDPAYGEQREIRPLIRVQGDGNVTLRFARYLGVTLDLIEAYNSSGVDGTQNGAFITEVDVYREWVDTTDQILVRWEPPICTDDLTTLQTQTAVGYILEGTLGTIKAVPADYNSVTAKWTRTYPGWWRQPTSFVVKYTAGYPLKDGRMDRMLERAVVFLALNYLDCPWNTCEPLRALMEHWRTDLAERRSNPGESIGYVLSPGMLSNPLGTTRAAVNAWRVVQQLAIGQAVVY